MSFEVYSVVGQTERETKTFFGGCNNGGHSVRLSPRALGCYEKLKTSLFVKLEIIPLLLCNLLDPFTNKYSRARTSRINSVELLGPSSLSPRGRSKNYLELPKQNLLGNMMLWHLPCLAWTLFMVLLLKILKLILISSYRDQKYMCWTLKKTTLLNTFVGNFLKLLEQQFCQTHLKSWVECAVDSVQIIFSGNTWSIWFFCFFIFI